MKSDIIDVAGVLGVGLLSWGAWMVSPPLGLIVPGAILTGVALFSAYRG